MRSFRLSYVLQPSLHLKIFHGSRARVHFWWHIPRQSGVKSRNTDKMSSVHILFFYCMFSFSTSHVAATQASIAMKRDSFSSYLINILPCIRALRKFYLNKHVKFEDLEIHSRRFSLTYFSLDLM